MTPPYDAPETLSIADRCIFSLEATIPVLPKAYNNIKTVVQTDSHVMYRFLHLEERRKPSVLERRCNQHTRP